MTPSLPYQRWSVPQQNYPFPGFGAFFMLSRSAATVSIDTACAFRLLILEIETNPGETWP
jgi:hypothetical protein